MTRRFKYVCPSVIGTPLTWIPVGFGQLWANYTQYFPLKIFLEYVIIIVIFMYCKVQWFCLKEFYFNIEC